MKVHDAIVVLLVGFVFFGSAAGDEPKEPPAGMDAVLAEVRLLRAEVKMLAATVKAKNERIQTLEAKVAVVTRELARVLALCAKAELDLNEPAPSTQAAEKSGPAYSQPLTRLLASIPKRLLRSAGGPRLTSLQWAALNAWCEERWPGKVVTAKLRVTSVRQKSPDIIEVSGRLVHPHRVAASAIFCIVRAEFPVADRGKLLAVKVDGTVSVVGNVRKPAIALGMRGSQYFARNRGGTCDLWLGDCVLQAVSKPKPTAKPRVTQRRVPFNEMKKRR